MESVPVLPAKGALAAMPRTLEVLQLSQGAGLAWFSLVANRILAEQVRNAHAWGEYVREQSSALAGFGDKVNDPTIAEALGVISRIGMHAGDAIVEAAVEWGRQHGHLAFAVPVTACPEG